jgi:hypothetical protein
MGVTLQPLVDALKAEMLRAGNSSICTPTTRARLPN